MEYRFPIPSNATPVCNIFNKTTGKASSPKTFLSHLSRDDRFKLGLESNSIIPYSISSSNGVPLRTKCLDRNQFEKIFQKPENESRCTKYEVENYKS